MMKTPSLLLAALLVPLLSGCSATPDTAMPAATTAVAAPVAAPEPAWVQAARASATAVPPKLLAALSAAIETSGPAGAIDVCKETAPKMAQAASAQSSWQIRRVSLGNRNPKAVPDAWERRALEDFDHSQKAGIDPAKLERWEVVTEDGQAVRRYMRALPTQPLCIQCHGRSDQLGAGVAERLGQLYPHDRATGYSVGQIRGAMTLRQPARQ
ncbi:MAG: DUF3365 domain-containing protein [Polaromonas sp.]|nr:DUF3365 domain-containing protein [Polaromonas sp.]